MRKLSLAAARRNFDQVLPRLVGDYESGRLVPFVGSGMSIGACTTWPTMIERLEQRAFGKRARGSLADADPKEIVERANSAVRALKSSKPGQFEKAMRHAVVARRNAVPPPTRSLAQLWWPLVLTTNYDNCYLAAFQERWPNELHAIVGRRSEDCQRVLTSLANPGRPLLWALQGHMNAPCALPRDADGRPDLGGELVVGHEEYRRVTYRDLGFRRAFAEVFRQRSLLFLGAGIKETYLQDLFGEVLEIYGPSSRPHYAIMPQGEVEPDFMLSRLQIRVIEFPRGEYGEVTAWLDQLVEAARFRTQRQVAWSFGSGHRAQHRNPSSLEIVRGSLPRAREPKACMVLCPARLDASFEVPRAIQMRMRPWGVELGRRPEGRSPFVREYVGSDVFLVRARADAGAGSLTAVYDAASALFQSAGRRYETIHMQLPSSGAVRIARGSASEDMPPSFPPRFSLIQTVRAWRAWRLRNRKSTCRLVLHTLNESVTMEIAAGRLDVLELLSCVDVRFWAEVARDDGAIERRVFELLPDKTKLRDVAAQLDLASKQWTVEVSPRTNLHREFVAERRVEAWAEQTLHELGVVPGSTLHFRRAGWRKRMAP